MPGPMVETTPTGRTGFLGDDAGGNTQEFHGDVRATGAQFTISDLDDG